MYYSTWLNINLSTWASFDFICPNVNDPEAIKVNNINLMHWHWIMINLNKIIFWFLDYLVNIVISCNLLTELFIPYFWTKCTFFLQLLRKLIMQETTFLEKVWRKLMGMKMCTVLTFGNSQIELMSTKYNYKSGKKWKQKKPPH